MSAKTEARKAFPKVPEEMFRSWFDAFIEKHGLPWDGGSWPSLLRYQSVSTWKKLEWEERDVDLIGEPLTPSTEALIEDLRAWVYNFTRSDVAVRMGAQAHEKAGRIDRYAGTNKALPSKLIFLSTVHGLEIVDGCHRLAVFKQCRRLKGIRCVIPTAARAWIGFLPAVR